jgi:hypothetical protein
MIANEIFNFIKIDGELVIIYKYIYILFLADKKLNKKQHFILKNNKQWFKLSTQVLNILIF